MGNKTPILILHQRLLLGLCVLKDISQTTRCRIVDNIIRTKGVENSEKLTVFHRQNVISLQLGSRVTQISHTGKGTQKRLRGVRKLRIQHVTENKLLLKPIQTLFSVINVSKMR